MELILTLPADLMREQWLEKHNKSEILRNVKPRFDYILVDPDPCRNYYRMHGPDGAPIDIEVSTAYSAEHNSISGRIIAMPSRISEFCKFDLDQIQVGDRVYFHFNCLDTAKESGYGVEDETGYLYCGIHISMLYCAVRYPGEIIMISNHILVNPIEEDTSKMVSKHGIILKDRPDNVMQHGIVMHCGKNNRRESEIKPGDQIIFEQDAEFEMVIEGKKYYKQTHDEVLAIIK